MAISGSQRSLQFALGGVARGGAFRAGVVPPKLYVSVGGIHRAYGQSGTSYRVRDLTVDDSLGEVPNTCRFTAIGFTPTVGMDVIITLGSKNSLTREFGGQIVNLDQTYLAEKPANQAWNVSAIDYTWGLGKRKVAKKYTSTTIAIIAADLIASYASGYTVTVEAAFGATTIDEFSATNDDLPDVLSRLVARGGGYWLCDYFKVVRLFTSDTSSTAPTQLTAAHLTMRDLQVSRDLSQMITRVYFEGMGSTAAASLAIGETILPLQSVDMFHSGGGIVVSGPQRITYTGRTEVSPGAEPIATPASGSGLTSGTFAYAFTNVTGAGETVPSPLALITLTGITPTPATALIAGSPTNGGSVDLGSHDYEVTFVTSSGETTPSPISGSVMAAARPTPTAAPAFALGSVWPSNSHGGVSGSLKYTYIFSDGTESLPSPASSVVFIDQFHGWDATVPSTQPTDVSSRILYMSIDGGATYARSAELPYTAPASFSNTSSTDTGYRAIFLQFATSPPSVGPTVQTIPLSNIPIGDATVSSRKLYRRFNATGTFKLVTTIANNTATSYTDTAANASLGAAAPSSNTATALKVQLSSIIPGPPTTTARKVYRTAANASQLQLLTTLSDNVATTYLDATADAGLGANAPTSDTSGLSSTGFATTSGTTAAGATFIACTAAVTAFSSTGGWIQIGDMTVRYTSTVSNIIFGIPATGPGSILAAVPDATLVQGLVALTGIPASGPGSILYAINNGDDVNLLVQVDDVSAQTTLAGLIGGDGIQETYVQDRRVSYTEATARASALLAQRGVVDAELRFTTRDLNAKSGRTQSVNVAAPMSVSGDFIIQQSTLTAVPRMTDFASSPTPIGPTAYPQRTIHASSNRFTFEDLLRQGRRDTT